MDKDPQDDLAQMRETIDTLDKAMRDILYQRTTIVAAIAALKSPLDGSGAQDLLPIRPQREAAQWASLVADYQADKNVPLATLASIWRQTIGASLAQQSTIDICADKDVLPLARDYFGVAVNYSGEDKAPHPQMVRVVAPAQAIIPDDETYFAFIRIPLMGSGCAFCYGRVPLEDGADDVTLIRSRTIQGKSIAEAHGFYFCEIDGKYSRDEIQAEYQADWLGVYPRPLDIGAIDIEAIDIEAQS